MHILLYYFDAIKRTVVCLYEKSYVKSIEIIYVLHNFINERVKVSYYSS